MNILGLLWDNLGLVVLAIIYIVAVGAAKVYGGNRLAVAIATVGIGHMLYRTGRKQERDAQDQRADNIERKRKDAYAEIDQRGTTKSDAAERLRKGNY